MKALALVENGSFSLEDRPIPKPQSGEVLLRVTHVGVCGSDLPRGFEDGAYHYPLVLGHEFAGVVEKVPAGSAFSPGELAAVFPLLPDHTQPINQIGEYAVSQGYDYFGSRRDGGLQEYVAVPESNLFPVPPGVPSRVAAMTEPCAVAYHAVDRAQVHAGQSAAVIGGGPIGNMVAQWLRIRGAWPVIVAEPDEAKRTVAQQAGFAVVDPTVGDPVDAIREQTDGGADIVVEACGLPVTFRQALAAAGLFGQVVFLGNINGTFTLEKSEFSTVLRRELTIYGTWNSKITPRGSDEWTRVLRAMQDQLVLEPLISHEVSLSEAESMLRAMYNRTAWYNKVIIRVGEAPFGA